LARPSLARGGTAWWVTNNQQTSQKPTTTGGGGGVGGAGGGGGAGWGGWGGGGGGGGRGVVARAGGPRPSHHPLGFFSLFSNLPTQPPPPLPHPHTNLTHPPPTTPPLMTPSLPLFPPYPGGWLGGVCVFYLSHPPTRRTSTAAALQKSLAIRNATTPFSFTGKSRGGAPHRCTLTGQVDYSDTARHEASFADPPMQGLQG